MLLKALFFVATCCFFCACTVVKITKSNGRVSVERHFGFVEIKPVENVSAMTAELYSLGYSATPLGYSLGYSKQSITTTDENCHLIIWIDKDSNNQEVLETLKTLEGVCITQH